MVGTQPAILLASVYVFAIMMVAYYAGQLVMNTFGISIRGCSRRGLIVGVYRLPECFSAAEAWSPEAKSKSEELADEPERPILRCSLAYLAPQDRGPSPMIISSASTVRHGGEFPDWVIMVAPPIIFLAVAVILWGCLHAVLALLCGWWVKGD